MSKHAQKRSDIQGLRAIAIFGVLLFHLAPKRFTNGFLGVDTFFVLSGYLMSSILSRESTIDSGVVENFYLRRFKRIVPLYTIMLAILAVIVPFVFLPSDMPHFITDMEWALPFAENMQNVLKQFDYWNEVFNSPVLLHAWSLGVEIQYYLIVPYIMIIARLGQTRQFRMIAFLVFILCSYVINFVSSSTVSFGLLFARVWQFLTGSVFFECEGVLDERTNVQYEGVPQEMDLEKLLDDNEDEFDDLNLGKIASKRSNRWQSWSLTAPAVITSYGVTFFLIWMVIVSTWGATTSRVLITFVTGCLLLIGKYSQNRILSNEIMVYIGDLSYLIYLAHWPVIILYKYYSDVSELEQPDIAQCVLATLIISILLHHSVESFFIVSSTAVSVIFVGLVYSAIGACLLFGGMQHLSEYAHPQSVHALTGTSIRLTTFVPSTLMNATTAKKVTIDWNEAIKWNLEQSKVVYFNYPTGCVRDFEAERWTGVKDEVQLRCVSTGNGTAKVLVIGNSYGYRAFPVLHRLFNGRYAQMRMFTKSARVYITKDPKTMKFSHSEKIVVQNFQPDITFLVEKDSYKTLHTQITGRVEDDPMAKYMQSAADLLSINSGTVVIDTQYAKPHLTDGVAYIIQKRLQQGKTALEDLRVSRKEYDSEFANANARYGTIKNENVIVNRVEDQLCPGVFCYFFNRDNLHAYYGDKSVHLTPEGLKLLEPRYSEIIEDFLRRFESRKGR